MTSATIRRVNEKGLRHLAAWINATANDDHRHTDPQNLDAWASEAEESMGAGNPPMVEMQAPATLSGSAETFTIPADGIYEADADEHHAIGPAMDLDALAERMAPNGAPFPTEQQARAMRDQLTTHASAYGWRTVGDVDDSDWFRMLDQAMKAN